MTTNRKTVIVTGASQGIGEAVVNTFLQKEYNVVANSRHITTSNTFKPSENLALVDGDIGKKTTAEQIVDTAINKFGTIDALVNNAGIFFTKAFTDYTKEDLDKLLSTNIDGFLFITQLSIKQMLEQKTGGSIVSITSAMVEHPLAKVKASVPMITKGGIDSISRSLAMEYAKMGIRVNTVAPGQVNTPMHKNSPKEFLKSLSPMGCIAEVKDIADAVLFLTEASQITGEVLHVDGGTHLGQW